MTGKPAKHRTAAESDEARRRRERRERRERIFGEVLPESTRDDRDENPTGSDQDAWLRRQVPPHHG